MLHSFAVTYEYLARFRICGLNIFLILIVVFYLYTLLPWMRSSSQGGGDYTVVDTSNSATGSMHRQTPSLLEFGVIIAGLSVIYHGVLEWAAGRLEAVIGLLGNWRELPSTGEPQRFCSSP